MKLLILCLALCVVVMGERCHQASDCSTSVTLCSSGSSLACIHNECTCTTQSGNACTTAQDCHQHCHNRDGHCVDGSCHCRQG